MKKRINLTLFALTIIISGAILTSCQNKQPAENASTPSVDSPQVAPTDNVTPTITDTIKPNTMDTTADKTPKKKPMTLIIDNLGSPTAPVEISVYTPENKFPSEKGQLKKYRFTPSGNTLKAEITDLPFGEYAVAMYQDLDADGKIAKNMIGIPTDPYGFSQNYIPKIKAPAFKDCAFAYNESSAPVNIKMIRK